ncbi:hypothetical protein ACP4OV_014528 [Aristida adscensionis]
MAAPFLGPGRQAHPTAGFPRRHRRHCWRPAAQPRHRPPPQGG